MKKNILITGMPKSGKSTILKKLIQKIDSKFGFVTNEILQEGERVGFEIETQVGQKFILAHINLKTNIKVSKYFVDITNLDQTVLSALEFHNDDLLFLDEIGQMQLFSENFKELVIKYLDSSNTCIATLSQVYSDEFIENIKNRNDVIMIEITGENREEKEEYIQILLRKISKAKKYLADYSRFTIYQDQVSVITDHGVRKLKKQNEDWICNCDFFDKNNICSHIIALEEYLKIHK